MFPMSFTRRALDKYKSSMKTYCLQTRSKAMSKMNLNCVSFSIKYLFFSFSFRAMLGMSVMPSRVSLLIVSRQTQKVPLLPNPSLHWTINGGTSSDIHSLERWRHKCKTAIRLEGTSWSLHPSKWNCVTSTVSFGWDTSERVKSRWITHGNGVVSSSRVTLKFP